MVSHAQKKNMKKKQIVSHQAYYSEVNKMGWIYDLIYKAKDDQIETMRQSNLIAVESLRSIHTSEISVLKEKIGQMSVKILELENDDEDEPLAKYWNNKHPMGSLTWNARSLPFSETKIRVPLVTLITPRDPFIRRDIAKWGFLNSEEDFETLVPKIYNKIRDEYYHYGTDEEVWGSNEVFEFPFEMRARAELNKGEYKNDCDSWAIFQVSYYRAIGLPAWRVRIVGGKTRNGGGHATVAIFSLKTNKWFHLNSTYGKKEDIISNFPTINDETDKIGIDTVWFSFNDLYSWYKFEEDLPSEVKI